MTKAALILSIVSGSLALTKVDLASAVVFLALEQAASRPQPDGERAGFFLVAIEGEVALPLCRRHEVCRNFAERRDGAERPESGAVFRA